MRRYSRFRRVGRPRQTNWGHIRLVASMLIILFIIAGFGYWSKVEANNQEEDRITPLVAELNQYKQLTASQEARKAELELKLKAATASAKAQQLTKEEAREMIAFTFPPELRKRFEKITMECENGTLQTDRKNVNKDKVKSEDVGMAQINSKYHAERVEKMFGMEFETAMEIPILNYIYAAFLVDHAGNFHQWVCDDLV